MILEETKSIFFSKVKSSTYGEWSYIFGIRLSLAWFEETQEFKNKRGKVCERVETKLIGRYGRTSLGQVIETEVGSGTFKNHPTTRRQSLAVSGLDLGQISRTLQVTRKYGCL